MLSLLLRSVSFWIAIIAISVSVIVLYNNNNNYIPTSSTTTSTNEYKDIKNMSDEKKKMKHVLINIAMEAESKPFIEHLQLQQLNDFFPNNLPFVAYRGIYNDTIEVTVITNGKDTVYSTESCNVGTVAAATISIMALQQSSYKPDIYINAGTAGGFQRNGASIGDIYVVSSFTYHDRRIPIPGYDIYGTGKLDTTINIHSILDTYDTWKSGICTTGDSLDKTNECDTIMLQNNATVKDMEVAAIAWIASLYQIKFGSIKVITDIVDGTQPTHDEFLSNLQKASEQLQHALPLLLDYIAFKDIEEL